jgi:hypothetical protein
MFIKIFFNYQGELLGQMNLGRTDPGRMCSKGERTRYEKITLLNSQPCLLMDQNEMNNLYRGPSIDAYEECSFRPDPLTNMAATGNSCF